MRIAIVSQPYYPQNGGVSEHVHHSALELRRLGHDVDVVTSRFRTDRENAEGLLRVGRNMLVPTLGAFANVNAGLSLRQEVGTIVRREYDVIHVHEPFAPTLPLVALGSAPAAAVVGGTFHASSSRGVGYRVFRRLLQPFARRLDARIAVSQAARRFVARHFDEDYEIIPNGVDSGRFHPRIEPLPQWNPSRPTLLFVGRFYRRKGVPVLLDALPRIARECPDVRLLVVGGGPLGPWYRQLASRAPCEVEFLGELSREDIARAYRTADVAVVPSTGNESFGIVHLEAMASGTPIVASDIEGYREILAPGREALLFPNRDADGLAQAVLRILQNPELARTMSAAGREKAARFAWSDIARRLEALFLERLDRKQRIRLAS
jgi:phosphatidylinositol alpha-mannosyltransferase